MKTKLTPELTENICKKLQPGTYAKVAAESEGITEKTLYNLLDRGEEALKLAEKTLNTQNQKKSSYSSYSRFARLQQKEKWSSSL